MGRNTKSPGFMDFVQAHERAWGNDTYPGRPELAEILQSPVVIFWETVSQNPKEQKSPRQIVTLHDNLEAIQEHFAKILFRSNVEMPRQRVSWIFQQQKHVIVRGIRVVFAEPDED